jgi:hypothetical protein
MSNILRSSRSTADSMVIGRYWEGSEEGGDDLGRRVTRPVLRLGGMPSLRHLVKAWARGSAMV